tara:strand:- start:200 stop:808 length:609 start_codon:yes stop_codon:yes gene_type:complete
MSKIKITLPENISEITLDQFQRFNKLNDRKLDDVAYGKRLIEIFTELKFRDVGKISFKDYEGILEQITIALTKDAKFENTFKIGDIEFGFIPNFDDITSSEYVDLSKYRDGLDNLHNMMAILYRPITKSDSFGNYQIETYNGTKRYAELMKQTPMHLVQGARGFFSSLANELQSYIQKSMVKEIVKEVERVDTLKNTDGILR